MKISEVIVDTLKFKRLDNTRPFHCFKNENKNFDVTF